MDRFGERVMSYGLRYSLFSGFREYFDNSVLWISWKCWSVIFMLLVIRSSVLLSLKRHVTP